jgi:hypothetical protein
MGSSEGSPPSPSRLELRLRWLLFAVWSVLVVIGTVRHEYWRDEVRALSLARNASSAPGLLASMANEGHPILWHFLLYLASGLTSSNLILPIVSLSVAAAAIALLIFRCSMPLWIKALFVFGRAGLYEYSVMARNYGISMLLCFAFAWMYPKRREHPLLLGAVLALLANTNIHSVFLAGLLMAFWWWDERLWDRSGQGRRRPGSAWLATLIVVTGMAGALVTVWPVETTCPSNAARYTAPHVLRALLSALSDPSGQFGSIAPRAPFLAVPVNLLFVSCTLILVRRRAALATAWAAAVGLSIFFEVVYSGSYRHQALFIVFLMTLYWMVLDGDAQAPQSRIGLVLSRVGSSVGLPALLIVSLAVGVYLLGQDIAKQQSASRALASFISDRAEYANAILMGEPDFYLESVRYYADNPIYIVRERRFGDVVSFTSRSDAELRLGDLLRAAWSVHQSSHKEVLVALGHVDRLDPLPASATDRESVRYGFDRTFSWTSEELQAWRGSTRLRARFSEGVFGDERFAIYQIVAPPPP